MTSSPLQTQTMPRLTEHSALSSSDELRLIPVHPDNLHMAKKDVEPFISQGLEYVKDKYNLSDIYSLVSKEELILWVIYNTLEQKCSGCLLTSVLKYPRLKALNIFLISANNFEQASGLFEDLKDYARSTGCESIEFYGRSGWDKKLQPLGFKKSHIVMRCDL